MCEVFCCGRVVAEEEDDVIDGGGGRKCRRAFDSTFRRGESGDGVGGRKLRGDVQNGEEVANILVRLWWSAKGRVARAYSDGHG